VSDRHLCQIAPFMLTSNFRKTVEIAERVISRLEREENWLLVVDNLDNLDALCKLDELNTKAILLLPLGNYPNKP